MPKDAVARSRAVEVDDEDDFRKRAQINLREKKDNGLFKLPEGPTTFRILRTPSDKQRGSPSVWIEYYVHRSVGPKKKGPLRCGLNIADDSGSCWLCKVVDKLREQGKTLAAAELERKTSYAVQVAAFDETSGDFRGPLLWVMTSGKSSRSLSYKIQSIVGAPASKGYVDHENGYNFTIDRTGTTMTDTVYGAPARAEERTAVPAGIISKLKPFADVLPPYDKEIQKKAYYGEAEEEEQVAPKRRVREEEEEEEIVRPKAKARIVEEDEEDSIESDPESDDEQDDPPPKGKAVKVDEDEDDDLQFGDDEEDVEASSDDEEDEEPVRPTAKKSAKKVVAEDEDDLAADEDEEPVKPKSKRR